MLISAQAAAATLPPPIVAVPLVAGVLGAGLRLGATLWNRAHSAIAAFTLGVAVRSACAIAPQRPSPPP